ncbi:M23 family metallopeptidase [Desulfoprunum benzoelyticum]|jgi:murein DD-endopeptidase MepM/ murein hydrolase activator NlpD|nr:M23 family metallopeptidase [Desulfoprunum benzoelyticum]
MRIPFTTPVPYFTLLEAVNEGLAGVKNFDFYPGMLFGSRAKWWPDTGTRPTAHEGIDICYYTDGAGREQKFSPRIAIPAMASGQTFAVCRDFLGHSVFIDHGGNDSHRFLSVYAHIVLHRHVHIGRSVGPGDVVGTVADTTGRKNRMPAHLHISLMRIPQSVPGDMLDWKYICSSDEVELIDPLSMLNCHHIALHSENPGKEREQTTP